MIDVTNNDDFIMFSSPQEKIAKLKEWGLLSSKSTTINKPFLYKGYYTKYPIQCDVIGYVKVCTDYETAVILVNNKRHKIYPEYLKLMQSNSFKLGE